MKFLKWLNGHKTVIGLILLQIVQVASVKVFLGDFYTIVQEIIIALTGAALVHRVAKKAKKKQ